MNKTLDIHIANQIFHIDENAYEILKNYLDAIKDYLAKEEGREEIMQDIESRIAELFLERMLTEKQVMDTDDVNEIIITMGQPEDYNLSDDKESQTNTSYKTSKKLYRDKEEAYISGLSAGIAHYINIDTVWVRLLWILLTVFTTGWFIILYIILWILVPEAKTTADKLHMKGEAINLSNIEKKIKESYDNVSEKLKDVDIEKHSKNVQSSIAAFFSKLEIILKKVGRIFIKFIGFILVVVSGLGLLTFVFGSLGLSGIGLFSDVDFDNHLRMEGFINSIFPTWLVIGSIIVISVIPLLFIFIYSLRALFSNLKKPSLAFIISMLSVWVISIAFLAFAAINSETRDRIKGEYVTTEELSINPTDTLYIKMKGNLNYTDTPFKDNIHKIIFDNDNKQMVYDSNVDIKFHHTSETKSYLRVSKWSSDYDIEIARKNSQLIDYQYQHIDSLIVFESYMTTPVDLKHQNIGIDIDIYLPESTVLSIDKNTDDFLINYRMNNNLKNPYDKYYIIKDNMLKCYNCSKKSDTLTNLYQ